MSIVDKIISDLKLAEVPYLYIDAAKRASNNYSKKMFKIHQFGVTKDQWVILKCISEHNGIAQIDIAKTTYKDPAAITRMLDILEKKDYLKRIAKADDRRSYEVFLTENGIALVNKMIPIVQDIRQKGLEGIPPEQLTVLMQLLLRIQRNFEAP